VAILSGLCATGALALVLGILDHRSRRPDPYREAAEVLGRSISPDEPVYATGYLYLETAIALGRPIEALPRAQALHPGWRATERIEDLPPDSFVWIVERGSSELADVTSRRRVSPLFVNERAAIVRVAPGN
jgi:hypothetical protein